jgi:hypothetical protein
MIEPHRRAAELRTLMARLGRQRTTLQRISQRVQRAAVRAAQGDAEAVAATALHLQHYYTAVEDALVAIARALDGSVPADDDWHRQLLEQLTLDIPAVRPQLMDAATKAELDVLRRFRHRVRHAYDEDYDWARMTEPLESRNRLETLLPRFFAAVDDLLLELVDALLRHGSGE